MKLILGQTTTKMLGFPVTRWKIQVGKQKNNFILLNFFLNIKYQPSSNSVMIYTTFSVIYNCQQHKMWTKCLLEKIDDYVWKLFENYWKLFQNACCLFRIHNNYFWWIFCIIFDTPQVYSCGHLHQVSVHGAVFVFTNLQVSLV